MKAIITVDVPEYQIGQEISVYFKDTMYIKGTCESETEVYAKHDAEMLDKIRAEIEAISINGQVDEHTMFIRTGEQVRQVALDIIDKYRGNVDEI